VQLKWDKYPDNNPAEYCVSFYIASREDTSMIKTLPLLVATIFSAATIAQAEPLELHHAQGVTLLDAQP
jgi:hypothetical protein